jgi:hypothetical protein
VCSKACPLCFQLQLTIKLWLQQGESEPYEAIIPQGYDNISNIITLIRKDLDIREQLQIPKDCGTIKLYRSNGTALDVGLTLQDLRREEGYVNDRNHPIMVQIRSSRETSTAVRPFPPNTGAVFEGLPGSDYPKIDRSTLVDKISMKVNSCWSLLITAPSYTGKTSLANLVYNHWQERGESVYFISFALLADKSSISVDELEKFFKRQLKMSVMEVMTSDGYLITDETQVIYNNVSFWQHLKSGASPIVRKVLSFAVFGLSRGAGCIRSPAVFQEKWYYDDIKLTNDECLQLVESYCTKLPQAREILVPEILGNIFEFVNHHPGLVYLTLYTLCYEFPRNLYKARTIADFQTIIVKGELLDKLLQARCFSLKYEHILEMLGERSNTIMGNLISDGSIDLVHGDDILENLNRCGMCIADRNQNRLYFASEIMRVFYRELYYKALYGISSSFIVSNWQGETMFSVLRRILELFQPQSLLKSLSVGRNGNLYERIYQDEFYRSCFLIAPTKCHPDVGAIYGSTGYLDFYIDGDIQLGFELLRNGVKINGHLNRFDAKNGIYKDIPLHDYAVIDFYQIDPFDGTHFNGDKYYAAVFSADFSSIQLWHNGNAVDIRCGTLR